MQSWDFLFLDKSIIFLISINKILRLIRKTIRIFIIVLRTYWQKVNGESRTHYNKSLEHAQVTGDTSDFTQIVYDLSKEKLDFMLRNFETYNKDSDNDSSDTRRSFLLIFIINISGIVA